MGAPVLRPYEPPAAPHVVALWWRAIGERYPLREEVLRGCLERNPSYRRGDALVAWDGDRAIGFGYVGVHRETEPETVDRRGHAWLQAVVVDRERRRTGIGRTIVGRLARAAAEDGAEAIECGGGFFYLWPGLPADLSDARPFAEAVGFEPGERTWDLRGDVTGLAADAVADAEATVAGVGLHVEPAGTRDREPLLAFVAREFGGEWWHDTRWFLDEGGDIADHLVLRDAGGAIAGFARLHTPETRPIGPPLFWAARRSADAGGLGPIGVAASLRGRGLGLALLTLGLTRLRDAGLRDVVIDFTTLLGFYGRLGFAPWMEFVHARGDVAEVLRRTFVPGILAEEAR